MLRKLMRALACSGEPSASVGSSLVMLQIRSESPTRWLGHASLRTTAIYADVAGPDERAIASRMWHKE